MFPLDGFRVTRGALARYASSEEAERGFCAACGTQLTFTAGFLPGLVDVTVGSLAEPERLEPRMHIWESSRLGWLELSDTKPRHAGLPPQP